MPTYDSFLAEAVRQAIETEVGKVEKVGLNKDGFAEVRVIETERLSHFVLEVECAVVFPAGKMTPSAAGTCVEKSQYTFYIHIHIHIHIQCGEIYSPLGNETLLHAESWHRHFVPFFSLTFICIFSGTVSITLGEFTGTAAADAVDAAIVQCVRTHAVFGTLKTFTTRYSAPETHAAHEYVPSDPEQASPVGAIVGGVLGGLVGIVLLVVWAKKCKKGGGGRKYGLVDGSDGLFDQL